MPKSMVGVFVFVACFVLFGIYSWVNFMRFYLYTKTHNIDKWHQIQKTHFVGFVQYLFDDKIKEDQAMEAFKCKIKVGLIYSGLSFVALVINSLIVVLI